MRARAGGTMKTWLTVAEGAAYSGVSRDTIYTACERREIRHVRVGGRRTIRLRPEWIDAWLEQHARGAETGLRRGAFSGGAAWEARGVAPGGGHTPVAQ